MKKQRHNQNRHHLKPKSRGGQGIESNLLWIKLDRHKAWHELFNNLTIKEVIALLTRVKRAKDNQKRNERW